MIATIMPLDANAARGQQHRPQRSAKSSVFGGCVVGQFFARRSQSVIAIGEGTHLHAFSLRERY